AKLQADVAAAQHDEVRGQLGELHDARRIEKRNAVQAGDRRHRGPAAGVDDDALAFEIARAASFQIYRDAHAARKARLAEDQLDVGGLLERFLHIAAEALDDVALALEHAAHVDLDRSRVDTVVRR